VVTQRTAVPGPRRYASPAFASSKARKPGGTTHMKIAPSRITARILLGPLACVGLLSCSSSRKASYDTASGAATTSSSAAPSSPSSVPSTGQSPESSASAGASMAAGGGATQGPSPAGSTADTAVAPSQASLPAAVHKHGSRSDRRHAHGTTSLGARALKREGTQCVPLASNAPARADFSSSPITVNPCGVGSMNLPTMAPPNLANPR
jgi:hypothetical protein